MYNNKPQQEKERQRERQKGAMLNQISIISKKYIYIFNVVLSLPSHIYIY